MELTNLLHGASVLLSAVLAVRLWLEGLHTRYRAFFAWLILDLVSGLRLMFIPLRSNLYTVTFIASTMVGWVVLFFVLRETTRLLFSDHPGIEAAARIGIWVSFGAAIASTVALLVFTPESAANQVPLLRPFFLLYQSFTFFAAILFIGSILFLTWFPVALRRNIVVYCLGFSIKFVAEAAILLLHNLVRPLSFGSAVSTLHLSCSVLIFMIWVTLLSREGEAPMVTVGHRWKPSETEPLLRHLDEVNRSLAGVLRQPRG